jgi:hypothetical protein
VVSCLSNFPSDDPVADAEEGNGVTRRQRSPPCANCNKLLFNRAFAGMTFGTVGRGFACTFCHRGKTMPKSILMDEIHVTVLAPASLSKAEGNAICRTLRGQAFQCFLRDAVRGVFRRHPSPRFRIDR